MIEMRREKRWPAKLNLEISNLPKYLSNFPYFTGFSAHSLVK